MTTLWINQAWLVMFVGHNAYYILVGINLLGLIAVVLFWPETKGISLEHMDRLFDGIDRVEAYKEAHRMTTQEDEKGFWRRWKPGTFLNRGDKERQGTVSGPRRGPVNCISPISNWGHQ